MQRQYSLIFILLIFLNLSDLGLTQKQRVDGGGNSKSTFIQQQPQQRFQQQQQFQQQYQQNQQQYQQQQPKYYSYDNGINDNGRSTQWYYFPQQQQQENYFPQQYNPQQNVNQQQQQFYSYSPSSSTSFASHAHGVPQLQAAQGAGGQYGNSINAIGTDSQFQQQSINQFGQQQGGAVHQQLTQFREAGQQLPSDKGGGVNSQVGSNNNQQQFYSYTTFPPLTLPPHPPTFATMMPSFFPTPPSQPVYDHALAQRMHKQPYLYNFDFAPGTPVIYCAYGANPIPRYNTLYKKCIPYHPLCGITFTCIFDVDPETGHVWNHAAETKKRK
ncbi:unnamed protein product [Meloidogyne enterolobii]|uniref:Uncharacterized protein n=1 Tax=Meloidogyne enterolobii TaxID=390850 RepID=A0ACB1B8D7_MELEN